MKTAARSSEKLLITIIGGVMIFSLYFNHNTAYADTDTPTATPVPFAQGTLPSQSNGGPAIVTVSNLIVGMQYRIVVSGVVHFSSLILDDAQWNDYLAPSGCFCRYGPRVSFNGVSIAAQNGQSVYDPNHSYTFLWAADSTQLQMYSTDSNYADNSGSFTYQIFTDTFVGTPTPQPTSTPTPIPLTQGTLPSQVSGGPGIVTISDLTVGMQYRIVVSGTIHMSSTILADPQWNDYQASGGCYCKYGRRISFNGVSIAAQNGRMVYDLDHTYTFLWAAGSTQLQMYITDSTYSDNSGSFTYQIFTDTFVGTPTPTPTNTPTSTKTSTPTRTPTRTPTPTFTPTSTPTNTPTFTPTNTQTSTPTITPTPNNGGSGICWGSGASWSSYNATYTIDSSIPTSWTSSIDSAADIWSNVTLSHFTFSNSSGTNNLISLGPVSNPSYIAVTTIYYTTTTLTKVTTVFSDTRSFDASLPPAPDSFSVENIMVHEFGHWLYLADIYDSNCAEVTMYGISSPGETKKITLESADEEAINWQYP